MKHTQTHTDTQRKWWGRSLRCRDSLWYNTDCVTDEAVSKQTLKVSATTSAVFVNVHADVRVIVVREGASSSQFLVVIFNQNCGGWTGKCVCLVECLAWGAPLMSLLFLSPATSDTEKAEQSILWAATYTPKLLLRVLMLQLSDAAFNRVFHEVVQTRSPASEMWGREKVC